MKTYQFPQQYLSEVIQHIASYGIKVLSMNPDNGNYNIEVEAVELPEGEYQHLNQEYQLEEIL
jgi:hypothetical protein